MTYAERAQHTWKTIGPLLLKNYKRDATFLEYSTPWQLLVAVILSAQTTDDMVNKETPDLFAAYPTPEALAKAPLAKIQSYINRLSFFRVKAGYIKRTAAMIVNTFDSAVPHTPEALQTLPGVGRKTAVAVISNLYDNNIGIAVDTHVIRFAKRFALSRVTDPSKIEQDLCALIPKKDWKRASYAMKEYGRREGKARGYKPEMDPLMIRYKNTPLIKM